MQRRVKNCHARLLCGASAVALGIFANSAHAEARAKYNIQPQSLAEALVAFGNQSGRTVLIGGQLAAAKVSRGFTGDAANPDSALRELLAGTGLSFRRQGDVFVIVQVSARSQAARHAQGTAVAGGSSSPQVTQAGEGGGAADVDALIVTAQKREEDIQDVPIAISAFSQEDLTRSQIAGGPDLITQVPNMTFTKTNFSSYSIQIRGIGTQAISATTDPAVAVAFNNTPFVRNRFFEQEFYDLQRIEVLRGPQGTLYGRNATAGVVNIISAKPKFAFEAKASADVSNFNSTRIEGMVNVPLADDAAALRLAGAWTKRDGYATNELTGNPIDGRDLWSTRLSLRMAPNDALDVNLIWEHFQENDDRLRSGKQLCKKDVVTEVLGGASPYGVDVTDIPYFSALPNVGQANAPWAGAQATLSQGCERNSFYSSDSFQTPNGLSIPYYVPLGAIGLPIALLDPYVSEVQSQDLRVIESTVDPEYQAKSDLAELQISFDISDNLTLQSETSYSADTVFSQQDFNRFNTASGAWEIPSFPRPGVLTPGPNGPVFCDPQIGCSDRLVAIDISSAKSRQFSQEFRLSSDYDGAFNFSLGANFLRYDTEDKYYVFINSLSLQTASPFGNRLFFQPYIPGVSDNSECLEPGPMPGDPDRSYSVTACTYMDSNPIGALNDEGHNYFLSKNPYKLISYAVFGEAYYNISDTLKLTGGLRWTVDRKEAPRVPSWLLASNTVGYPVAEAVEQEWAEPTGRLTIDWKPELSFTDETLLYGSYAHGYKAGGANPPPYTRVYYGGDALSSVSAAASATRPKTFEPEFVDALEVGAKNTLADGAVTLNLAAFYYDYKDYQISEIVDRSAFNRNFDATVWGVELEADWRPLENLRLGFKGGYEKTRIADGEEAIDLMDRTAGDPNWVVVRPFPTFASNCILPTFLFAHEGPDVFANAPPNLYGVGSVGGGGPGGCETAYLLGRDPVTALPYVPNPTVNGNGIGGALDYAWFPNTYPGFDPSTAPNNGEGIAKPLGGNELPNAPNWTGTITADYSLPLPNDWLATVHTDLHWQSESWWRVFNDHEYGKLDEYFTMNLAAIFVNEEAGWNIMAYIKNVTDETAITGAFLFSDDTGLTTNVFLTEPRLYGLRVTKAWTGVSWWNTDSQHPAGEPYRFTLELGGQVQRRDAPYAEVRPIFLDHFSSGLQQPSAQGQNKDLDWGDGREVKLTYAVPGGKWRVSAGLRTGEANRADKFADSEFAHRGCLGDAGPFCGSSVGHFDLYNYVHGTTHDTDEHQLIDFAVGRDVGLGVGNMQSRMNAGVRYAEFSSGTRLNMEGVPDWEGPDAFGFYYNPSQHHHYQADFQSDREFEGAGPVLSWDVSRRLFGQDDSHVDLDASIEGGVLFGKQKTSTAGEEQGGYYDGIRLYRYDLTNRVGPIVVTPAPAPRSTSVTVPTLGASLGLSYEVQRLKLSAGYRWERYFDVLDAGWATHDDADRTIEGPYFKVSVGFGG